MKGWGGRCGEDVVEALVGVVADYAEAALALPEPERWRAAKKGK